MHDVPQVVPHHFVLESYVLLQVQKRLLFNVELFHLHNGVLQVRLYFIQEIEFVPVQQEDDRLAIMCDSGRPAHPVAVIQDSGRHVEQDDVGNIWKIKSFGSNFG